MEKESYQWECESCRRDIERVLEFHQSNIDQLKKDGPKDVQDLIKKDMLALERQLLGVIERFKTIEEKLK